MQAQINNLSLNKRLAKECLDMFFNQHKVEQATTKYIGANYRQHNPNVADGPNGITAYATGYIKANPELRMEFKRIIAEDDLVAVHNFLKPNPSSLGTAVVDILRVEDGNSWNTGCHANCPLESRKQKHRALNVALNADDGFTHNIANHARYFGG